MKVAIISAMQKEIAPFIDKIKDYNDITKDGFVFRTGKYKDIDIVITHGGIGKVNTGIIVTLIHYLFPDLDLIINIGISGGIIGSVAKGEIVISSKLAYSDVDTTAFGDEFGQVPDMPKYFFGDEKTISKINDLGRVGLVLTGDTFMTDKKRINELSEYYDEKVLCVDMESAAFAHCSYVFNIPFVGIRAISDLVGDENQVEKYIDYNKIACRKVCEALEKILR